MDMQKSSGREEPILVGDATNVGHESVELVPAGIASGCKCGSGRFGMCL